MELSCILHFAIVAPVKDKLVSAVADGPCDALCPLKSCQLLHETQLPQLECAILHVTMNGQMRRPNKLHGQCMPGRHTGGMMTVGGAINKPGALTCLLTTPGHHQAAMVKFSKSRVWDKSQREVPLFLELLKLSHNTAYDTSKKASMPKITLVNLAVLIEHRLLTYRQTQGHSIYCTSIPSYNENICSYDILLHRSQVFELDHNLNLLLYNSRKSGTCQVIVSFFNHMLLACAE